VTVFQTGFAPLYRAIVAADPPPSRAVAMAIEFEQSARLELPTIYASTTITTAGYKRDSSLKLGEVIQRNGLVAGHLMQGLADGFKADIDLQSVMLPTEMAKVPSWKDTHYLLFYFGWLSGLSETGARELETEFDDPTYRSVRKAADAVKPDAKTPDEERWPAYREFTEIALAKLAVVAASKSGKRDDGSAILLQLVDVEQSLGCRAERLYADARGLDRITITVGDDQPAALAAEIKELRGLGASLGAPRAPVELTPLALART
jgi:hypothetical protein